jgi:hypothetical protein
VGICLSLMRYLKKLHLIFVTGACGEEVGWTSVIRGMAKKVDQVLQ